MADQVSVTSKTGYGERVGNSFKKIFGGILLVLGMIWFLARNENNFVEQKAALNEGNNIVQETVAETINPELDGQLVHLQGMTSSPAEALKDPVFGVKTDDLKLIRKVEMYQWKESSSEKCQDNYGGSETCTTTYDYKKVWSDSEIDSTRFYESAGHYNPSEWEYASQQREKSPILVWAFTLGASFTEQLNDAKALGLTDQEVTLPEGEVAPLAQENPDSEVEEAGAASEEVAAEVPAETQETLSGEVQTGTQAELPQAQKRFHLSENLIYVGTNPQSPKIWDMKISFSTVKSETVSIVGKQSGEELNSYTTSNGRSISLLEQGKVAANEMFAHAHSANKTMTWVFRILGLLLMYAGFAMMFEFVSTLAKLLPPLAHLIGVGTSLIAFALTLIVGLGTIAIAWLVVRPLVGIPLLVVAVWGGAYLIWSKKKTKKAE